MGPRLIYFGTPRFAAYILEYLLKEGAEIIAVVSRPDKPQKRSAEPIPTPVKKLALVHNLPVYQPKKVSDPEFANFLKSLNADLFVVAAFAEILKDNVLEIPKLGCINVHASLLPKYRGAAPIERCVMAGEKESGITIMKMALELDAGDILAVVKTPILEEMTAGELSETLSHLGAPALWKVIQELEKGATHPIKQEASLSTYAKKLKPEEGEINWNQPCEEVDNHIRGVSPKPGAWVWVTLRKEKKRLLIKKARKEPLVSGNPGEILSKIPSELVVGCKTGACRLLEVQLEGKSAMPVAAFLRGIPINQIKFN